MSYYLTPDSPEAFIDHPTLTPDGTKTEPCPICKGHGGWNLRLNSHELPKGMEDTAENRHKYRHFRASCSACWGWGYIEPGSCAHDWDSSYQNVGNCLTVWKCKKCGFEQTVDSSD